MIKKIFMDIQIINHHGYKTIWFLCFAKLSLMSVKSIPRFSGYVDLIGFLVVKLTRKSLYGFIRNVVFFWKSLIP